MKRHRARLAVRAGNSKLGDVAGERHAGDAAAAGLTEPERAVAYDDRERPAARRHARAEFGDAAVACDPRNTISIAFGEPDVAVRPEHDSVGTGLAVGSANSAIAPSSVMRPTRLPVLFGEPQIAVYRRRRCRPAYSPAAARRTRGMCRRLDRSSRSSTCRFHRTKISVRAPQRRYRACCRASESCARG